MSEIKTKLFNYGNEKESSWPPRFGTNDNKGAVFYVDHETGKVKEGYPPPRVEKLAEAPQVIFDSMPPSYHEGACRMIESRKEWERADKEHNTVTFSTVDESKRHIKKGIDRERQEIKQDRKQASEKAIRHYKENPQSIREKLNKRAEEQEEVLRKSGLKTEVKKQLKKHKVK